MDLMSELKEKTNITRGITLNFKHFELFKMIEEAEEILTKKTYKEEDVVKLTLALPFKEK